MSNMEINKGLKLQIFKELLSQADPFSSFSDESRIMDFLEMIWELKLMQSEDDRFDDAYGDIYQHIVNNNDWDYDFLFLTRLNLLEDDPIFIKFLNAIINPETRRDENSIKSYYFLLQPYLKKAKLSYIQKAYDSLERPVYEVGYLNDAKNDLFGIKANTVPFIVDLVPNGRADYVSAHKKIDEYPYFVLAFDYGWNDYQIKSNFSLFYHKNEVDYSYFGEVKIIHIEDSDTGNRIPTTFTELNSEFCSLGQNLEYYTELRKEFGKDFESILWALRDSAFYLENQERFEQLPNFKNSLIRYNEIERLLREAKYLVYEYDLKNLYSFTYNFHPKFAENSLKVAFNFKDTDFAFDRIYSIIGKNGTGKTQLITSLPLDISSKSDDLFEPKTPLFSKVIAVSYSSFDSFDIPDENPLFNYKYCGLKNNKNQLLSDEELVLRFHQTRQNINMLGRTSQWIEILQNFIDVESLSKFIKFDETKLTSSVAQTFTFDIEAFEITRNQLSSGQSIILFIVTEIIANIRFDSLILYDEPETHLHPNAISQLVNTIYQLVDQFKSYCIITTHSPLIIQEMVSKNVFVIERKGDFSSIRRIGLESFGQNLSTLTEEVFGNREIPKQYQMTLKKMVDRGMSYEEITRNLEFGDIPLSINASIYLKSLLNEKS